MDAPPPYDTSKSKSRPTHEKKASTLEETASTSRIPQAVASTSKSAAFLQAPSAVSKKRSISGLFRKTPEPEVPSDALVKAAVLADIEALVQPYTGSVADRLALLESCSQLCVQQKLDFSSLLQGKAIENHSVLYWAIANGPWPPQAPFELVAAVLSHSTPLTPETIREARRACVSLRSQEMFHFLRMSPAFGALSTEDRLMLGAPAPPEEIVVEEMAGAAHPFSVRFRIPMFHKRRMLDRHISLQFIAQGRLFELEFFTAKNPEVKHLILGQWSGCLRMLENSLPTPLLFGLVILDARPSPPTPTPFWKYLGKKQTIFFVEGQTRPKLNDQQTESAISWSWTSFQHDSVCIASDGSVTGILGVKLAAEDSVKGYVPKTIPTTPEEQCIIC